MVARAGSSFQKTVKKSVRTQHGSREPFKKIKCHRGVKKRIMLFKFRTEGQKTGSGVKGRREHPRNNDSQWLERLLSFIREDYPEVEDLQFNDWVETYSWIKRYNGKPKDGFDLQMYKNYRKVFENLRDEEETTTSNIDSSDSEESHISMNWKDSDESNTSSNTSTPKARHSLALISVSSDLATINSRRAGRVSDNLDRQASDQSHDNHAARGHDENPEGLPHDNEDQGDDHRPVTDAETVDSSVPECSGSVCVAAPVVPCLITLIDGSNCTSGIGSIDTGRLQGVDTECPSTSADSRKRLKSVLQESSSSNNEGRCPEVVNRETLEIKEAAGAPPPIITPTGLSSPPTVAQLLDRIGTDTELGGDLVRSIMSLLTVDCPLNVRIRGRLTHSTTVICIGGSFSERAIHGPSFLYPGERELDFLIPLDNKTKCTLSHNHQCQQASSTSTTVSIDNDPRGEQMRNSVPPPLPDNVLPSGTSGNSNVGMGGSGNGSELPTASRLDSIPIPLAAVCPEPNLEGSENSAKVSQQKNNFPAVSHISQELPRSSHSPQELPLSAHILQELPRSTSSAAIGIGPNLQSCLGSCRNLPDDSASQGQVEGASIDYVPRNEVPANSGITGERDDHMPAIVDSHHAVRNQAQEQGCSTNIDQENVTDPNMPQENETQPRSHKPRDNSTGLDWLHKSYRLIQGLNVQFGLLESYRPLLGSLEPMFEKLNADHRRVVMPNKSRILNVEPKDEVVITLDDD